MTGETHHKRLSRRLLKAWEKHVNTYECPPRGYEAWQQRMGHTDMGAVMWVPETDNYEAALKHIQPDDVILDVGTGNLSFSVLAAGKCRRVYAVEIDPTVLALGIEEIGYDWPENLVAVVGDGRKFPVPQDVTKVVLLAIHFAPYCFSFEWGHYPMVRAKRGGGVELLDKSQVQNLIIQSTTMAKKLALAVIKGEVTA